jgi:hypothetical protein
MTWHCGGSCLCDVWIRKCKGSTVVADCLSTNSWVEECERTNAKSGGFCLASVASAKFSSRPVEPGAYTVCVGLGMDEDVLEWVIMDTNKKIC